MTEEVKQPGLDRRTVLKGAAWSVPVVAAAVATPAFAATLPDTDVRVTAICDGEYDISSLSALLADVSLVGLPLDLSVLTDLVEAALGLLGFEGGATRQFQISADSGTIPAGTEFALTTAPPALITLEALNELLAVQALFVADVNPQGGLIIRTTSPITEADAPQIVELQSLLLDADVVNQTTLTYLGVDNPNEAPNSGSINALAGVDVDLGTLDLGAVLETVLPGAVNAALRATIRLVLGLTGGLTVLDGLNLRVQLCNAG